MVRTMLDQLKLSSEPKYLVDAAMKYLRGLKGHLVQNKKVAKARAEGTLPGPGNGVTTGMGTNLNVNMNGINGAMGLAASYAAAIGQGGQGHQYQQGTAAWNALSVEDRLQGALARYGQ